MIKFQNQVPSVYPNASRDFQYLCWLINIVLNSVKHNVDALYDLPNSKSDTKLTELLAITLGFKVKRNYDQNQLKALVAALPRILKYKGTKTAVTMAGNALVAASGATGTFRIIDKETNDGELEVRFPKDLVDISLFVDLLPYVLPAGMTCHIVRTNQIDKTYTTKLAYQDTMYAEWVPDISWDDNNQKHTGSARLFEAGSDISDFANYQRDNGINDFISMSDRFTAGLLDNTIIPQIVQDTGTPITDPKSKQDTGDKNS